MGRKRKKEFGGVKPVKAPGSGQIYYYHRATGRRLPDDYGSVAFAEAWLEAERSAARPVPSRSAPGTFRELVEAFEASDAWDALSPRTQKDYAGVRDWIYAQGVGKGFVRDVTQANAEKLIEVALDKKWHRFAVYVLQYCRRLWKWKQASAARKKRWGGDNPWTDIPSPKQSKAAARRKANPPWLPEEVVTAILEAPAGLRRAYILGACGFDGGTMVHKKWTDYDDASGVFADDITREKTGVGGYTIVYAFLRPFLEQGERPSEYIITNQLGRPFPTANTLQTRSSEFLHKLAADGKVRPGLTLHGLRHTLGKAIADGGGDIRAIQNALRHSTERQSLYYSNAADGKRAAEAAADSVSGFFQLGQERLKQARQKAANSGRDKSDREG